MFLHIIYKINKRLQKIGLEKYILGQNLKNMSQELLNKLTYVQFGQKLMQIEVIDFEQNTVIFRILKISKK